MNAEQQVKVLARIWGPDRDGYVFLPWISGEASTRDERRSMYHEGPAFEWPRERAAIIAHLDDHPDDDVYFTPALFNDKRRVEQNVDAERTLWADLDPVDPRRLGEYRPTIAWETSPGRYQGVWLLNTPLTGASWPSRENHRLSLHIGADPSGWDSTQLLRVPGRANHKPDYGGRGGAPGRLMWDNGPRYTWSDFEDLPEVGTVGQVDDLLDDDTLRSVDRHDVWGRVRLKVSSRVRELMASRAADGADRSDALWEIERELADAGCTAAEIIAVVRASVWNKYAGRNDELKRLKIEAAKAISERPSEPVEGTIDDDEPKPGVTWLSDVVKNPIPRPRWLINDVWTRGGCGFISGAPKSYKSWLAIDMLLSVAMGEPFLGIESYRPTISAGAPVLYLQEEDDLRLVMDRISSVVEAKDPARHWHGSLRLVDRSGGHNHAGGAVLASKGRSGPTQMIVWEPPGSAIPMSIHVQVGFVASDPGWQAWLADMVATHGFVLVTVDTLGTTVGDVDTDRSGELMTRVLRPLKQIASANNAAVCVVHHNRKPAQGATRAGMEMLGSVALHAWVDCALYARAKDGEGVVSVEREAKFAPDDHFRFRVPRMHADVVSGVRQLWAPTLVLDDVGTEQPAERTPAANVKPSTGGKRIASKLKACGPGPFTLERIAQTLDMTEAAVREQTEAAITNGFMSRDDDGRLRVVS